MAPDGGYQHLSAAARQGPARTHYHFRLVAVNAVVVEPEGTVRVTGRAAAGRHGARRGGRFSACPWVGAQAACESGAVASASRSREVRTLWGRDSGGRFRTHGRHSQATVRGTRWLTVDRCDGTLTRVTNGAVAVRDLHRHRTVLVRAGHSYVARGR